MDAPVPQYLYKQLPFTLDQIKKAVETHPTPFHIYNEELIRSNAKDFREQFRKYFPEFKNYYAVKAAPNPHLLKILKEEGMGLDCSSMAELILAEKVGFKGEDIMFTSNATPADEYKKAFELGAIINLDDITHIEYLKENLGQFPNLLCLRKFIFRYNPGPLKKGNAIIGEPQQAKFGLTRDQVKQAYSILKAHNVTRFGLHCMVASNELQVDYFAETARLLFELVVEISKDLGIQFEFVNLGGGVGIPYRPQQERIRFDVLSRAINDAYQSIYVAAFPGTPAPLRVVMECGRVVTGPYCCLVSRALHRKDTYKKYIGLDACMANLMRPGMYGSYHHISVIAKDSNKLKVGPEEEKENSDQKYGGNQVERCRVITCDVTGSLCENNDKFAVDRPLPEIATGDIVVIHDTGAHGHSMGFNYNGKLRSAELLLKPNNEIQLIRRAETYNDLFATLDFSQL